MRWTIFFFFASAASALAGFALLDGQAATYARGLTLVFAALFVIAILFGGRANRLRHAILSVVALIAVVFAMVWFSNLYSLEDAGEGADDVLEVAREDLRRETVDALREVDDIAVEVVEDAGEVVEDVPALVERAREETAGALDEAAEIVDADADPPGDTTDEERAAEQRSDENAPAVSPTPSEVDEADDRNAPTRENESDREEEPREPS